MKNGSSVKIAYGVVVVLLALVLFILAGFRQDVAQAQATATKLQAEGSDHESRVRVLESNMFDIKEALKDINRKLDRGAERH